MMMKTKSNKDAAPKGARLWLLMETRRKLAQRNINYLNKQLTSTEWAATFNETNVQQPNKG